MASPPSPSENSRSETSFSARRVVSNRSASVSKMFAKLKRCANR